MDNALEAICKKIYELQKKKTELEKEIDSYKKTLTGIYEASPSLLKKTGDFYVTTKTVYRVEQDNMKNFFELYSGLFGEDEVYKMLSVSWMKLFPLKKKLVEMGASSSSVRKLESLLGPGKPSFSIRPKSQIRASIIAKRKRF